MLVLKQIHHTLFRKDALADLLLKQALRRLPDYDHFAYHFYRYSHRPRHRQWPSLTSLPTAFYAALSLYRGYHNLAGGGCSQGLEKAWQAILLLEEKEISRQAKSPHPQQEDESLDILSGFVVPPPFTALLAQAASHGSATVFSADKTAAL